MADIAIFIYPDGSVAHLHTDDFDIESLGPPTIRRASNIEPSPDSQQWEVRLPRSDTLIATSTRRAHALAQEVDLLTHTILPRLSSATQRF